MDANARERRVGASVEKHLLRQGLCKRSKRKLTGRVGRVAGEGEKGDERRGEDEMAGRWCFRGFRVCSWNRVSDPNIAKWE